MDNKSSQSSLLIGIVAALLVAAVAGDMIYRSVSKSTATAPEVSADADQTAEPTPQAAPASDGNMSQSDAQEPSEPMTKPATSAEKTDEQDASTTSSESPETETSSVTSIILQTVRVDSDGAVVIAGTGVPGQLVEILVNGEVFETAIADGQGNFVSLFDLPYSDAVRVLSLRSIVDGQELVSDQDAIIAPAQIAAAAPSQATTEPDVTPKPDVAETEVAQADVASETESQQSESNTAESSVAEQPESDIQAAEIETEEASTATQSVAEPATDSAELTNTGSTVAAAETEQVAEDASVVAAADESDTTASGTDESIVVSVTEEQTSEPATQGQTEQADASESDTSSAELATVSTKDSTQAPAAQASQSDSSVAVEGDDSKVGELTAITESSPDKAQPAESDEGVAAATNEDTTEEMATVEAETTQVETDELVEDTADGADSVSEVESDQTPTVMIADQDGVRVVQGGEAQSSSDVALDAISYDEEGEVALSGRGTPSAQVMVYLDNAPISSTVLDSAGQWKTDLTNVDPGVYTLRIDQLDTGGKVVSRLETPFQRENRERLTEQVAASAEPARVNVITVQPGFTLWAIARSRYGQGVLYVQVFEANRDKIRDPDLIYPGQVFQLPD